MGDDRLTKAMIAQSRVIAKGRRIHDVQRLVEDYGGRISRWSKRSSPPIPVGSEVIEYHWYEHPGLGRFEIKRKRIG